MFWLVAKSSSGCTRCTRRYNVQQCK